MRFIWATRGRTWGFRFLRSGGFADPLPVYETAFAGVEEGPQAWQRVAATATSEAMVALRFPDPLERRDRAGRVIPHDVVVFPPEADEIGSVEDGLSLVWPQVADEFARIWEAAEPPPVDG